MRAYGFVSHAQSIDSGVMEPDTFLRYLQTTDFAAMLRQLLESCGLTKASMFALPAIILLGILWCFFGLKLVRIWSAVTGLTVGLVAGLWDAEIFGLEASTGWFLGIILGGLLAFVAVNLYLAGVFLTAWCVGGILAVAFLHPADWIKALVCVGIGLLIALTALRFAEITTIILTGALGGAGVASGIAALIPSAGRPARIVIAVLLAVAGIAVQSVMEYRKRKKEVQVQAGQPQGTKTDSEKDAEADSEKEAETGSEKEAETDSKKDAEQSEKTETAAK